MNVNTQVFKTPCSRKKIKDKRQTSLTKPQHVPFFGSPIWKTGPTPYFEIDFLGKNLKPEKLILLTPHWSFNFFFSQSEYQSPSLRSSRCQQRSPSTWRLRPHKASARFVQFYTSSTFLHLYIYRPLALKCLFFLFFVKSPIHPQDLFHVSCSPWSLPWLQNMSCSSLCSQDILNHLSLYFIHTVDSWVYLHLSTRLWAPQEQGPCISLSLYLQWSDPGMK